MKTKRRANVITLPTAKNSSNAIVKQVVSGLRGLSQQVGDPFKRTLPADLLPDYVRDYEGEGEGIYRSGYAGSDQDTFDIIRRISENVNILASTQVLDRGLIGRAVTVGTTPVKIIDAQFLRGYLLLNPSAIVGTTATGTVLASGAQTAAGNTQASSLGVSNYRDLHIFLDVTAASGGASLDIIAQAKDPVSGEWFDVQQIYTEIVATGRHYVNVGGLGVASDFAIRWTVSAGSITFSVGFVLKDGLPGGSTGISNTIYLGNDGVTPTAGFPLLEGQQKSFYFKQNTELYAVANQSLTLNIFEL